jgi:hypothetical protein
VSAIADVQLGQIVVAAENGGSRCDEFIKEPREKLTQDLGATTQQQMDVATLGNPAPVDPALG